MIRGSLVTVRPAREHDRRAIYQWLAESDLTPSMLGPPNFPDAPEPTWDQFCEDYGPDFFDGTRQEVGRSFIIELCTRSCQPNEALQQTGFLLSAAMLGAPTA
jgi:hypothetical protein